MPDCRDVPKPPSPLPYWVAHTPSKTNPRFHSLKQHILAVAEMAQEFATPLRAADIAYFLGLLHDLGKFTDDFQVYLLKCYLAAKPGSTCKAPAPGSAPHKQAGALAAARMLPHPWGPLLAVPLHGHHGGMLSLAETPRKVADKVTEEAVNALIDRSSSVYPELTPMRPDLTALEAMLGAGDTLALEMYLRLIYSCLVDADSLDTEAHNDPDAEMRRRAAPPVLFSDLMELLQVRQDADFKGKVGAVHSVRREVYETCLKAADEAPGFFELTVPTGGGKTRSSLAFALQHAARHGLRRVVYAIPYTSIVDQTADVFRSLFAEQKDVVLEHHSAIDHRKRREELGDDSDAERWRRLVSQNWDAPLVVTTTVQLFESLFSNRPSACRKLHRLAGAVIVLDEAQCLPSHLLAPIRSGLKTLVDHFGATVIFCTATQPAHELETPHLAGIEAQSIISGPDRTRHFNALKRVRYRVETEPWSWERVAKEIGSGDGSRLCVVNTRRQALELLRVLDPNNENDGILHLSTLLCGQHRKDVIAEVTRRLKHGPPALLISTQCIEAGVDLDFPKAMRAMGPLERIIQAAGRCNREGSRPVSESEVLVFTPEDGASPGGHYRMALGRTVNLFRADSGVDLDDPSFVTSYFRELYKMIGRDGQQVGKEVQDARAHYRYDEVAQKMRLIEEDTVSVFVSTYRPEEAGEVLSEALSRGAMTRELWRRAQRFCVALPGHAADPMKAPVEEVVPGLLLWKGAYDSKLGIPIGEGIGDLAYAAAELIIS